MGHDLSAGRSWPFLVTPVIEEMPPKHVVANPVILLPIDRSTAGVTVDSHVSQKQIRK
jgi:hypothetical protein